MGIMIAVESAAVRERMDEAAFLREIVLKSCKPELQRDVADNALRADSFQKTVFSG
jgi:hypothetical protein